MEKTEKKVKQQKHGKTEKLRNETDGFVLRNQNDGHNVKKERLGPNTKR